MTNNPTIDGVSRELIEQSEAAFKSLIKQITEEDEDGDYWRVRFESRRDQLRTLLDAPAAERQPIKNASEVAYNLQAEAAALQSTIAQLQARIVELESGRGEPVMKLEAERLWEGAGEYAFSVVKSGWLDECRKIGGEFLLYTAPPDPVAAVLTAEQFREALVLSGYVDEGQAEDLAGIASRACLDATAALNGVKS